MVRREETDEGGSIVAKMILAQPEGFAELPGIANLTQILSLFSAGCSVFDANTRLFARPSSCDDTFFTPHVIVI